MLFISYLFNVRVSNQKYAIFVIIVIPSCYNTQYKIYKRSIFKNKFFKNKSSKISNYKNTTNFVVSFEGKI